MTVTVTDGDGGTVSHVGPVQVNAPAARVGTGSGTFKSPKKSSKAKPTKKGKASFSYTVSTKPIAGSTTRTPYGSASLTFGKGKVRFAGRAVTWFSSTTSQVRMTVTGKVNGKAGYTLTLVAIDEAKAGAGKPDLLRIRITKTAKGKKSSTTTCPVSARRRHRPSG